MTGLGAVDPGYIGGARTHCAIWGINGSMLHLRDGRVARRSGGHVTISDDERGTCHCEHPCAVDAVCQLCGGSMWWCCGRADSEPHRRWCHTRAGS